MRIRVTLEYDGANYSGWQLQSGQDSIQARIESALAKIFGEDVRVHGAGRTDAGVHARGQVAAFDLPRPFAADDLRRALNAILPPDVAVTGAAEVSGEFDPRRAARSRIYEYRVLNREYRSAFEYRYAWLVRDLLDLEAMNAAARVFIGEHDFAGFRTLGSEEKSTVRRIHASAWRRDDQILTYRIEATAFLRHMVRSMVAAMVEVGRGKRSVKDVVRMIASGDRALVPAAAPACGLFLIEVRY
jgi:tRNA pseudouridine38-40 synthase